MNSNRYFLATGLDLKISAKYFWMKLGAISILLAVAHPSFSNSDLRSANHALRDLSLEVISSNFEDPIEIKGQVRDENDSPLPGVTIRVKDSNAGTVSDAEGKYVLEAPSDGVLVFSSVGFIDKEVPINSQGNIDVVLETNASNLNELVVVGYGTQKKADLTGSISNVSFDSTTLNRPITDASQALAGKSTGLWVSQNSGMPGDDGAQMRVRGWGTLNDANPLVIIDGIEGSMDEVNPNDIESVSVLKDAASAAIYGSRAANGVILITTKSGSYGQKTKVSLSSYVGVQSLGRKYDVINNSAEYMKLWNQALINQGGDGLFPDTLITSFENKSDPYRYPNTDFYGEVFRNSPITKHDISVNGGTENTKYQMSLNYLYQDGMIPHTNSERYGLKMSLESKIGKIFSIGGRLNGFQRVSREPYNFGRVLYIFANGAYPFTAPYTKDGEYGAPEAIVNGSPVVGNRNPLIEAANGQTKDETNFLKMNVHAKLDFTDYLSLQTSFAVQTRHLLEDKYNNLLYGYTDEGLQEINLDYVTTLEASRAGTDNIYSSWFNTLNFNKTFNLKHDIMAVVGMQVENTQIKNMLGRRSDPPKDGLTQVDAGTNGIVANGNLNRLRMLSYFGRVDYTYDNRYLFEFNFRSDASSRFARGQRWGYFPGVSGAWRLSNEEFMQSQSLFSDLKLRASWGSLGNENISGYSPFLTVINSGFDQSYNFSGALAPGGAITALANEGISWETSKTTDLGLDFGLFNGQLSGSLDVFRKITDNIIVQLPIPTVLGGLTPPFQNIGKMLNKGIEASLTYAHVAKSRDDLGFNLSGNLTYIDNKVTKFQGGKSPDQLYLIREGFSYQELYGLKAIGIFQSDQEADDYMFANGFKPKAGNIKYLDVNEDGKIDSKDKTSLGNTIPKFTFGFQANLNYKGFDLSILLQGIADVNAYTDNAWTQPFGISGGTVTKRWENAWTEDNHSEEIPSIKINDNWDHLESSFWVSNISFFKARNVQLGYSFPKRMTSFLHLSKLYAYVNAQNLFTITSKTYEGFDPERSTFDSGDNFYPIPRILSFGINVEF